MSEQFRIPRRIATPEVVDLQTSVRLIKYCIISLKVDVSFYLSSYHN